MKKTYLKSISYFIFFIVFFLTSKIAKADCKYDGTNFVLSSDPTQILMPIHRLFNRLNGAYLYTRSVTDANYVLGKWSEFEYTDPVPAFCAHSTPADGLTPIYRLYNTKNGMYLYTRGEVDRDYVLHKWPEFEFTDGTPSFYASLTPHAGLTPIYRLFNTKTGAYLYTRGEVDRDYILNKYKDFEFTDGFAAFYADLTNDSGPILYKYQGPDISVGLWYYSKNDIMNDPFQISANKTYNVKDVNGNVLAQIDGGTKTYVSYNDNQNQLTVTVGSLSKTLAGSTVTFDSTDGDNYGDTSGIIFDTHRSNYVPCDYKCDNYKGNIDKYRGKISVHYYRGPDIYNGASPSSTDYVTQFWIDNTLPLEEYTWGSAEVYGTGPLNHTEVMETMYRTYGLWYINNSTKYSGVYNNTSYGFKIRSDSGSQNYGGYNWESDSRSNAKNAAQQTRGDFVAYNGDVAITPYSSWSDGNTRTMSGYPWCQGKSDPYGKHPVLNYKQLYYGCCPASDSSCIAQYPSRQTDCAKGYEYYGGGNHMFGLIANGSLNMAKNGSDWQNILNFYYSNINIQTLY